MKPLVWSLILLLGVVASAEAKRKPCRGAFRRSCLNKLYRCFTARGSCTVEGQPSELSPVAGATQTCYENGAHVNSTFGLGPDPSAGLVYTNTYLWGADGKLCVTAAGIADLSTGINNIDLINNRSGQNWRMIYARDGLTVICPNGRAEQYSLEQVAGADCGGSRADCAEGTCP